MMRKAVAIAILAAWSSVACGAATTMYVTPAGAGSKAGTNWATAFGYPEWEADLEGSAEAGDIYYVAGGTYTLTNDLETAKDGTIDNPIKVIGVASGTVNEPPVFSDYAFGDDRPHISGSTYEMWVDNYWHVQNLRITSGHSQRAFRGDTGTWAINLKVQSTHATANTVALGISVGPSFAINCEAISNSGATSKALALGSSSKAIGCYIHDSVIGVNCAASTRIYSCIIDTCTTGIAVSTFSRVAMINNTMYNCTTGISGSSGGLVAIIVNNIIDACTTGVSWGGAEPTNFLDYNCWDNTTNVVNVTQGDNAVTGDPSMTNPANGDFTLQDGSNCLDAGAQMDANMGVTGDYKWNIGADQGD